MALLDISEPEGARPSPASGAAFGLDFGTTHSLVAVSRGQGDLEWVEIDGSAILPSVVATAEDAGELLVGRPALQALGRPGFRVLPSVKRLLGRPASELPAYAGEFLCAGQGGVPRFQLGRGDYTAEELAAAIVSKALAAASELAGGPPSSLVVTVPAYFDEVQRQAVRNAARLAGRAPDRLVAEPTAAALSLALQGGEERLGGCGLVAVYDLGGGTFDCSILEGRSRRFEVRASAGDTRLGGDDFDALLADAAAERLGLAGLPEGARRGEFLQLARRAKEELTRCDYAVLAWDGGEVRLSRADFERAIAPLVERTLALCRRALRDAEATPEDLDGLLLVGGASRVPLVRAEVSRALGLKPVQGLDQDRAVAEGAARLAASLAGLDRTATLVDVTPLSLGIETLGGLVEKIVPRNSAIPLQARREFTTGADNQTAIKLHVVQGERERVEHCRSLARFRLGGLPPAPAGIPRVAVTFEVDADGLLRVSAAEEQGGARVAVEAREMNRLSEGEVEGMLQAAAEKGAEDAAARRRIEALLAARQLAGHLRRALREDARLLDEQELAGLEAQLQALEVLAEDRQADAGRLKRATQDLALASEGFAQRRMDAGVKRAMLGRKVGELPQ